MRNWAWCVGVALTVTLTVAIPAHAVEWEVTQVTDYDGSDGRIVRAKGVAVSDIYVAWRHVEVDFGGDLGLRLYDGSEILTLSAAGDPEGGRGGATISREVVFWSDYGYPVLYDGENVRAFGRLGSDSGGTWALDVSGPYVAWMEYGGRLERGSTVHLTDWTQDSDRIMRELEPLGPSQFDPRVSDSHMIWREADGIYLYDIEADVRRLLPDTEGIVGAELADDYVIWRADGSDEHPEDYEIFVHEIESATTMQLTDNRVEDTLPAVSGMNTAWKQCDGQRCEIMLYDGSEIVQVTDEFYSGGSRREPPSISGEYLAWVANNGGGIEIYVYDGNSITEITHTDVYKGRPVVGGSRVAWLQRDGDDTELFLATRVPEPSTIALLITAGVALLLRCGRRSLR